MSFGHLVMLSVGAGGLSVATDSPDAFCPPLEEAQAAVAARVGAVTGGQFEARYGVQRDANTGAASLRLSMRDEAGKLVLERELPLDEGDCSDAATVMALILERYFASRVGEASPDDVTAAGEAAPEPSTPAPAESPTSAAAESRAEESTEASSAPMTATAEPVAFAQAPQESHSLPASSAEQASPFSLRLSLAYSPKTLRLGLAGGFQLSSVWQWLLEVNVPLMSHEVSEAGYDFSVARHAVLTAAVASLRTESRLRLFAGPELGLQWQQARVLDGGIESSGTANRFVPSLGAQAGLSFEASRAWEFGVMSRGAIGVAGHRFVVEMRDGEELELFPLPEFYWQAGLFTSLRF